MGGVGWYVLRPLLDIVSSARRSKDALQVQDCSRQFPVAY